jgi:hypothetical protein
VRLRKEYILIALGAAIVIYLVAGAVYNFFLSEEQKIKNLFHEMKSDVESGQVLGFGEHFTKDASIQYGDFEMDVRGLVATLFRICQSYGEMSISFSELLVELKGDSEAVVTFGGEALEKGRNRVGRFEGTARLRRESGDWRVYNATGRERNNPRLGF